MMAFVGPFIVMQNAESGCQVDELIVRKAKLSTPRMLVAKMIIDQKGFVQQHPAGLQCMNEVREERTSQIKAHKDDIVGVLSEIRIVRWRQFQIDRLCRDPGEVSRVSGRGQLGQCLIIAVYGVDLVPE